VQAAFKDKPTLLFDNCGTQVYLGAGSIETAERVSKSLGDWTQVLEGYNENTSRSWSSDWVCSSNSSQQLSRGNSLNYSVNGRPLLRPDEVLTLSDKYLVAFHRGMPPILAKRIKYYEDAAFTSSVARRVMRAAGWGILLAAGVLTVWTWICGS
jgi:type IV secretion system protein VirD4